MKSLRSLKRVGQTLGWSPVLVLQSRDMLQVLPRRLLTVPCLLLPLRIRTPVSCWLKTRRPHLVPCHFLHGTFHRIAAGFSQSTQERTLATQALVLTKPNLRKGMRCFCQIPSARNKPPGGWKDREFCLRSYSQSVFPSLFSVRLPVCECRCRHATTHIRRSEDTLGYPSSTSVSLELFAAVLLRLAGPQSSRNSPVSTSHLTVGGLSRLAGFRWGLTSQSFCLCGNCGPRGVISPASKCLFLTCIPRPHTHTHSLSGVLKCLLLRLPLTSSQSNLCACSSQNILSFLL